MTEQYRNGSDDDDFFLPRQHCNGKNFFFYPPFPSPFPILLLLPKEKEKLHFHHLLNSTQSNPIRSPKYHHLEAKRKKEEQRKTSPLPFGRTYLTYLAPILFPPIPPLPRFDSHFPSPNPYKFPCLARLLMCKVCALCTFFCPLFPFLPSRCIGRWN